jgi:hypothetical protein
MPTTGTSSDTSQIDAPTQRLFDWHSVVPHE